MVELGGLVDIITFHKQPMDKNIVLYNRDHLDRMKNSIHEYKYIYIGTETCEMDNVFPPDDL